MRTPFDRVRQAVSFEVIGLALVIPSGALLFGFHASAIGGIAVIGATLATLWNYLYNLGFDHLLRWARGGTAKTLPLRIVHAVGFEGGLLLALLPIFSWWLDISPMQAFVMDLSFSAFYLCYTFVFTWGYDALFPA